MTVTVPNWERCRCDKCQLCGCGLALGVIRRDNATLAVVDSFNTTDGGGDFGGGGNVFTDCCINFRHLKRECEALTKKHKNKKRKREKLNVENMRKESESTRRKTTHEKISKKK